MKPLYVNSGMHMNKTRPLPQLKKCVVGAMLLLTCQLPALAGPACDSSELNGEYWLTALEIRQDPVGSPPLETTNYCDIDGQIVFDGVRTVTASLAERCSATGARTFASTQFYDVSASCDFSVYAVDPGDAILGHIYKNGRARTLVFSAVTRRHPRIFSMYGTAMQR
jgi:hypothetical protein